METRENIQYNLHIKCMSIMDLIKVSKKRLSGNEKYLKQYNIAKWDHPVRLFNNLEELTERVENTKRVIIRLKKYYDNTFYRLIEIHSLTINTIEQ